MVVFFYYETKKENTKKISRAVLEMKVEVFVLVLNLNRIRLQKGTEQRML